MLLTLIALAYGGEPWPVFHGDAQHTGRARGTMNLAPQGPVVRWQWRAVPGALSENVRWNSSFAIGDLDDDRKQEVVVTLPSGADYPGGLVALRDDPTATGGVSVAWRWPQTAGQPGVPDQYSVALAPCDDVPGLDVVVADSTGLLHAISGRTGRDIWTFDPGSGLNTEAGPTVADLDNDGKVEIIYTTGGNTERPYEEGGAVFVLPAKVASGTTNRALWSVTGFPKADSGPSAVAKLTAGSSTLSVILIPTWGKLVAAWKDPSTGAARTVDLPVRNLPFAPRTMAADAKQAIRSGPMITGTTASPMAVFGWMRDTRDVRTAEEAGVRIGWANGTVTLTGAWTEPYPAWKSSPAAVSGGANGPVAVVGYGMGFVEIGNTGGYARCRDDRIGGIVALDASGRKSWGWTLTENALRTALGLPNLLEGSVRGSVGVVDLDNDGDDDVVLPVACVGNTQEGALYAFDGKTGTPLWRYTLPGRTISTPSFGDLDNDGNVEMVMSSYDGVVYALQTGGMAMGGAGKEAPAHQAPPQHEAPPTHDTHPPPHK